MKRAIDTDDDNNGPSLISSLPGELFGILSGDVMLIEPATKLALDPLFKNFADTAGLKPLHRSSILASAIWEIVNDENNAFVSLSEFELKSIIFTKFQQAVIAFVKVHPEVVPEMTRAWIVSMLSKQKSQAEYEFNKFMAKTAGLDNATAQHDDRSEFLKSMYPNLQKKSSTGTVTCKRCGKEGVLAVYSMGKAVPSGEQIYAEVVRHDNPDGGKPEKHWTRKITKDEFVRLRAQYGTKPMAKRKQRAATPRVTPVANVAENLATADGKVKCHHKGCALMGVLTVFKDRHLYHEGVRHHDPKLGHNTRHYIRKLDEAEYLALRQKYGVRERSPNLKSAGQ